MGELLATLRRRNFALLWSGGLVSTTGDWMLLVALPIYVYQATGSALATGAMFAAGLSPSRLLGLGAVLFGMIDLAIFVYPSFVQSIAVGLTLFVLVGIPATALLAGLQTLLQTSAEDGFGEHLRWIFAKGDFDGHAEIVARRHLESHCLQRPP